jgi:hypothetical protein
MGRHRLAGFVSVALAAGAAGAGTAGGDASRTVTVEPPGLGVSLAVPSSWGRGCDTGTRARFSIGPLARRAKLDVFASAPTAPLAAIRPALVTELRRRLGPRAVVAATTRLASGTPALRLRFHYHGAWPCGSVGVGEIRHAVYFVVHAGTLYAFDFVGIEPWASRDETTFERTARSIRFVQVA